MVDIWVNTTAGLLKRLSKPSRELQRSLVVDIARLAIGNRQIRTVLVGVRW